VLAICIMKMQCFHFGSVYPTHVLKTNLYVIRLILHIRVFISKPNINEVISSF